MPFLKGYDDAVRVLKDMEVGKCKGSCRSVWMRNIKYALKTKSNPLKLSKSERKRLNLKLKGMVKTRRSRRSSRNSTRRGALSWFGL
jgi:hypothetical protein